MRTLLRDSALAIRLLRRAPAFTIAAVLTLALGLGANASVFSLAETILFAPLPVPDADRLVHAYQVRADAPGTAYPLAFDDYLAVRDRTRAFEAVAAHYAFAPLQVIANGEPSAVTGAVVTASYFDVLRLRPVIGRFFRADEDERPDRDAVAIISDRLWARHYARDASALGGVLTVNGRIFSIIGVAPAGFEGAFPLRAQTDVWIPSAMFATGYRYCDAFARGCDVVQILGRLGEGRTLRDAQVELDVVTAQLASTFPETHKGRRLLAEPARGRGPGAPAEESRQLQLQLAVVGLVLLIACSNVAGLLLARSIGRRKEIAIRIALGASRGRVLRQLLTEAVVLAACGGCAALLVAFWGNTAFEWLYAKDSAGRPLDFRVPLSAQVASITALLTIGAAFLFGLLPAALASREDVAGVLKDEGALTSARRIRVQRVLVGAQLALSVILLIGGGLVVQSMRHLHRTPGIDSDNVVLFRLRPSLVGYTHERAQAYLREVMRQVAGVPGVLAASPASYLAVVGSGPRVQVSSASEGEARAAEATVSHVGPAYFETIGLRLLDGRTFVDGTARQPRGVILNDVLARKLWPGGRAVGRTILAGGEAYAVLAVIPDAQFYRSGEPPRGQVFFDYWHSGDRDPFLKDARLHIRVDGSPDVLMQTLRRTIAQVDPNVPITEDEPLRDRLAVEYQPVRVARLLLGLIAGLALLLSAVGLYGVLDVLVRQRTREIALRVALGAGPQQVRWVVVRDALLVTIPALLVGTAGAVATSGFLATLLYGVAPRDPAVFAVAWTAVGVIVGLVTIAPIRFVGRILPAEALRSH